MTTFVIYNAKRCARNGIGRITGYIDMAEFVTLMRDVDNKVNPRGAKYNRIVDAVHNTLSVDPELFWLKSKGLLLSTTNMQFGLEGVDRTCVSASFTDPNTEGVMDGGHTMLAVSSFILDVLFGNKIAKKDWKNCKETWATKYTEIRDTVEYDMQQGDESTFNKTRIPVDVIYPESPATKTEFLRSLTTICGARNANVQLSATSKMHHKGMYSVLKDIVPCPELFQWKEEQDTGIKLAELTMLADIPLNWLISNKHLSGPPSKMMDTQFYASKQRCVQFYEGIMSNKTVSEEEEGRIVVTNSLVLSALRMTRDLIQFYDKLYMMFPKIYNATQFADGATHGVFSRTNCCTIKPHPARYGTTSDTSPITYPDGIIIPLLVAASELITISKNKKELKWIRKPQTLKVEDFIKDGRQTIYVEYLKQMSFSANDFGKASLAYQAARRIFVEIAKGIQE
jgi:hypothetical protein